jgi:hypothetical protein
MPELNETKHDLIDVGEENGAEINFDDNNEPQKEEVVEEKNRGRTGSKRNSC